MSTATDEPQALIDQLRVDLDRFGAVVVRGGNWEGDSPCDGWSATDVLDHVISTERDFLSRHGADLGAMPDGSPAQRWHDHAAALGSALTADLVTIEFDGYFGPTTVGDTLRDFYGFDLLVHRWDLGVALGQAVEFTDDELDRLEELVPEPGTPLHAAFYSDGICRPALPVPPGASRQSAVLAAFGRAA